jgi:hypothetical protein
MKTKLYTGIPLFLVILLVCTVVPPGAAENQTLAPINMSQPYVYEIRDLSNPITESEIIDLRSNLISKQNHLFRSTEGDGPTLAYANPRILDNGTIVAYGFYIDPEGTTHQLIGVVNDESCIDDMYEIANQWLENMSNEQNLLSSSDVQDGWDCFSQDDLYYEAEPYGLVENNYELYRNIEEDDPDQDCYAVKQFFSMEPGFHRWREENWSKWISESGFCWNDWSYAPNSLSSSLHNRQPFGTYVGPTTLQLSLYPEPCMSWSLILDSVSIEDNSDPVTQTARWDMSFNSAEAQKTIQGWRVGSSILADVPNVAGEYHLTRLYVDGKFVDPTSPWYDRQYRDLRTAWDFWVDY